MGSSLPSSRAQVSDDHAVGQVFQHSGGRPGNKVSGNVPNLHLQGGV